MGMSTGSDSVASWNGRREAGREEGSRGMKKGTHFPHGVADPGTRALVTWLFCYRIRRLKEVETPIRKIEEKFPMETLRFWDRHIATGRKRSGW
jgi:hypothetical protein